MATEKKATAEAEPKKEETPKDLPPADNDGGAAQAQSIVDGEEAQGFRGTEVDPTPNENYSVAGVTAGLPTPETDADAAKAADARFDYLSGPKFDDSK